MDAFSVYTHVHMYFSTLVHEGKRRPNLSKAEANIIL